MFNNETMLGDIEITYLFRSYTRLAKKCDSDLTQQERSEEQILRNKLNAIGKDSVGRFYHRVQNRRNNKSSKNLDETAYLLNRLLKVPLESRFYFPRILSPQMLLLGEDKIYDKLEHYLFDAKNQAKQYTPWRSFHYEFEKTLNEVMESKEQDGHRGDHVIEEVVYKMLKIHYDEFIGPMDEESFKSMYQFFESIDAKQRDDILTVMCEYFERTNQISFESMKLNTFFQGFECYALPTRRITTRVA